MSIECVWLAALDKRQHMIVPLEEQVNKYIRLPLNVFWSGDGTQSDISYDRIDWPASDRLFSHCSYGVGEGRKNHANAFLTHREIFTRVLANGNNNVLLLEEDIYFIEDRWNRIYWQSQIQEFINAESCWDAIYFSWHQEAYPGDSSELNEVENAWETEGRYNILQAKPMYRSICGLHAVLLNRRMLERLSKIETGPMDTYLNKNINRFRLFYFAPQIIGSLPSFSAAEQRWQDRKILK